MEGKPSKRISSFVKRAEAYAGNSDHNRYKHVAMVVGRSFMSIATNVQGKTCPMPSAYGKIKDKAHAEMRALHYASNTKGATLLSIRAGLKNAKPCAGCLQLAIDCGIKTILYSNGGEIHVIKLNGG
jgi:tRNA(Arg) A34 adenosine deaminase TadA